MTMAIFFDILRECTKVKGEIGELVVSRCLKKMGFIVRKPRPVLRLLERAGVERGYEFEFLKHHQKTMDFFAVYPRDDPLVLEKEAICEVFKGAGLNRYMAGPRSEAWVVEVKTGFNGVRSRPSTRQKQMFHLARKMGFGVIIGNVALKENYVATVSFEDEKGNELEPFHKIIASLNLPN